MATVTATGSGTWSTVIPAYVSNDVVELGGYGVVLDTDIITRCTITNTSGGFMTVAASRTINADLVNRGYDGALLTIATTGIVVNINGMVTCSRSHGSTYASGVLQSAASTLTISNAGTTAVYANAARAVGVKIHSGGCTILGNLTVAATYGICLITSVTSTVVNVTGNGYVQNGYIIAMYGGRVNVTGDLTATTAGVLCGLNNYSVLYVRGNVTGIAGQIGIYPSAADSVFITGTATNCGVFMPSNASLVMIMGDWSGYLNMDTTGKQHTIITGGAVPAASFANLWESRWFHFGTPPVMPANPGRHYTLPALADVRLGGDVLRDNVTGLSLLVGTRGVGNKPELITNGTFDTDLSGWTLQTSNSSPTIGTIIQTAGTIRFTEGSQSKYMHAYQAVGSLTIGARYRIRGTMTYTTDANQTYGNILLGTGASVESASYLNNANVLRLSSILTNKPVDAVFTTTVSTVFVVLDCNGGGGTIVAFDNISLREESVPAASDVRLGSECGDGNTGSLSAGPVARRN